MFVVNICMNLYLRRCVEKHVKRLRRDVQEASRKALRSKSNSEQEKKKHKLTERVNGVKNKPGKEEKCGGKLLRRRPVQTVKKPKAK